MTAEKWKLCRKGEFEGRICFETEWTIKYVLAYAICTTTLRYYNFVFKCRLKNDKTKYIFGKCLTNCTVTLMQMNEIFYVFHISDRIVNNIIIYNKASHVVVIISLVYKWFNKKDNNYI